MTLSTSAPAEFIRTIVRNIVYRWPYGHLYQHVSHGQNGETLTTTVRKNLWVITSDGASQDAVPINLCAQQFVDNVVLHLSRRWYAPACARLAPVWRDPQDTMPPPYTPVQAIVHDDTHGTQFTSEVFYHPEKKQFWFVQPTNPLPDCHWVSSWRDFIPADPARYIGTTAMHPQPTPLVN